MQAVQTMSFEMDARGNPEQRGHSGLERYVHFEKTVAHNLLFQLFADGVAQMLTKNFYPEKAHHQPQFLTNGQAGGLPDLGGLPQPEKQPEAWCRFQVQNFCHTHFAKDPFPSFIITVSQLNGDPLPRVIGANGKPKPMADTRVRLSVHNKWADVSNEVLPDTEFVRVLKDGRLELSDLVFQDVSLKHGGYFIMHIDPIDFSGELQPWRSPKFMIQSVKTHCIKKRKMAAVNKMQALQMQQDEAARQQHNADMNSSPAFNPQIPHRMVPPGKGVVKGELGLDSMGSMAHHHASQPGHEQHQHPHQHQHQQSPVAPAMVAPEQAGGTQGMGY